MQKIMFNNKYGLTAAVLQGRKTMTRRLCKDSSTGEIILAKDVESVRLFQDPIAEFVMTNGDIRCSVPQYQIGEVVAIAQRYKDAGYTKDWVVQNIIPNPNAKPTAHFEKKYPGWRNKMFVIADLMPHRIRITDVKVDRLQDISDDDVHKEGFSLVSVNNGWGNYAHHWEAMLVYYDKLGNTKTIQSRDPREAFSVLIDKVSGRGTWDRNPWVFAYSYELVK